MGRIMKEDDIFISGLFDLMNIRFGPSQGEDEAYGGIPEMKELQKEFQIFRRPFPKPEGPRCFERCVAFRRGEDRQNRHPHGLDSRFTRGAGAVAGSTVDDDHRSVIGSALDVFTGVIQIVGKQEKWSLAAKPVRPRNNIASGGEMPHWN